MRFPEDAPVMAPKKAALLAELARLRVDLAAVDEQATRGSGPGGQKKNKTYSGVLLRYHLGDELLVVRWTKERQHALNRFFALRQLAAEVELRVSPETSQRLREAEKRRKQKDRQRRRHGQREGEEG